MSLVGMNEVRNYRRSVKLKCSIITRLVKRMTYNGHLKAALVSEIAQIQPFWLYNLDVVNINVFESPGLCIDCDLFENPVCNLLYAGFIHTFQLYQLSYTLVRSLSCTLVWSPVLVSLNFLLHID